MVENDGGKWWWSMMMANDSGGWRQSIAAVNDKVKLFELLLSEKNTKHGIANKWHQLTMMVTDGGG